MFGDTESDFHHESPTFLVVTPGSSGVTVNYTNGGKVPRIDTNVDQNDPNQFVWASGRVNIQDERRETETKGARTDLTCGGEDLNLQFGAAHDDASRQIRHSTTARSGRTRPAATIRMCSCLRRTRSRPATGCSHPVGCTITSRVHAH